MEMVGGSFAGSGVSLAVNSKDIDGEIEILHLQL